MKTINIKGKEYVPVVERVKEAHTLHKDLEITTEMLSGFSTDETRVAVKAIVKFEGKIFTGHSQAVFGKGIMGDVALEIAETSAIGRALGFANIGLLDGIASADEMRKVGKTANYNAKNKKAFENGEDPFLDDETGPGKGENGDYSNMD